MATSWICPLPTFARHRVDHRLDNQESPLGGKSKISPIGLPLYKIGIVGGICMGELQVLSHWQNKQNRMVSVNPQSADKAIWPPQAPGPTVSLSLPAIFERVLKSLY